MNDPIDEEARLAALRRYEILDTPEEAAFDCITRIAAQIVDTPIALVSLVDDHRQWFKSHYGLEARETPRAVAFCAHAIRADVPLVVDDATRDPRFSENPLVTGAPHVRFYAGAPLKTSDGHRLGTLCTIDRSARSLTRAQEAALRDLAQIVVDELELRLTSRRLANELDISERSRQASHDSDMRTRTILNTVFEGIIVIDERGIIESINPAAERIFQIESAEITGCNINLLMPQPDRGRHGDYINAYLRTGQTKIIGKGREVMALRRDGRVFPVDLAITEMVLGQRRLFVGALHDVSERKALELQLQQKILEISQSYETIRQDLESAAQLQKGRLPHPSMNINGVEISSLYIPSTLLSGDMFSYFAISGRRVVLYSVDVSGHGVPAALLAVTLSHTLVPAFFDVSRRLGAATAGGDDGGASLADICVNTLARLNERFTLDEQDCQYFTIGFCVIDPAERKLAFGQAGHPNLLIVRKDGRVSSVGEGGVPIGFLTDDTYPAPTVDIAEGDRLVLLTDGVTECANEAGRLLEESGVGDILSSLAPLPIAAFTDALKDRLIAWKGDDQFSDDVSLIVAEI